MPIRTRWLVVSGLAVLAANLPLLVVLLGYRSIGLSDRIEIIFHNPNQFLFLLAFFPFACFIAGQAGFRFREFMDASQKEHRLWRRLVRSHVRMMILATLLGLLAAYGETTVTFRGFYSLEPEIARDLSKAFHRVFGYLAQFSDSKERMEVRDYLLGIRQLPTFLRSPAADAFVSDARRVRAAIHEGRGIEINRLMTWADMAKMMAVVVVGFHVTIWSILLLSLRVSSYRQGLPAPLQYVGSLIMLVLGLFSIWIGLRLYSILVIENITGVAPPNMGGIAIGGLVLVNVAFCFATTYARERFWPILVESWSVVVGMLTAVVVWLDPFSARRIFGSAGNWPGMTLLAIVYVAFLSLSIYYVVMHRTLSVQQQKPRRR
jgi:hypothetical protein